MTDKAETPSASEVDKQLKAELQRFKELQQNNLPALAKLLDSYEKANERLTAAGLKLSGDIKRLGDKGDNQWAQALIQIGEQQATIETMRGTLLERPLLEESIGVMNQSVTTDKDNFKTTRKRMKTALKRMDAKIEKLRTSSKGKDEPKTQTEIKELEAKKAEMAAYFRQYESMRYCKTLQAFCAVMNTQQTYHSAVLAKLEAANTQWQAAVAARPAPLPADTWSTYLEEKEKVSPTPAPAAAASGPRGAAATAAQLSDSKGPLASAPRPKPSSKWKLFATEDGEDYYYFNEDTGDSLWELPAGEAV